MTAALQAMRLLKRRHHVLPYYLMQGLRVRVGNWNFALAGVADSRGQIGSLVDWAACGKERER
jgi:hypothetical protein